MKLKETGKSLVARTARNPIGWSFYKLCGRLSGWFGRIYGHAHFAREIGERDETLRKLVPEIFPELTVAGGPFRGMRYPSAQSYGSALLPKLLGSYESELHPVLEEMLANDYTTIVDIGCAEGYYAVGLGMRLAHADVYAFDVNPNARKLCADVAKLNGLDARLRIGAFCDQAVLRSIPLGSKALIISDCEGYEGVLFTSAIAGVLATHDIIVETHDFIDIDISSRLRDVFLSTHQVRSIKSTDDIEKAHTYRYSQLDRYDTRTRQLILGERRPAIMEWLVMTPR
jgi:hypothetical protein